MTGSVRFGGLPRNVPSSSLYFHNLDEISRRQHIASSILAPFAERKRPFVYDQLPLINRPVNAGLAMEVGVQYRTPLQNRFPKEFCS